MSVLRLLKAIWRVLTKGNPETRLAIQLAQAAATRKRRAAETATDFIRDYLDVRDDRA